MDAPVRRDATTDEESTATVSPPPPPPRSAAAADPKKLRRNARDRSRSQLKKNAMETMRQQVTQLEAAKRQLEQTQQLPSPRRAGSAALTSGGDGGDDDRQALYLRVLQETERLRRDNRAMALDVLQRDLFRSAVQNLVDARANDVAPLDDPAPGTTNALVAPLPPSLPAMPERDAAEAARRIARQIATSRLECDGRMQRYSGARVFGWSDFRLRTDASVQFTIQKTLPNQSASLLANRTFEVFADIAQLRRLLPADVRCDLRTVQRVGDDAIVFDRVTRSPGLDQLQYTALRTTYMLVRARDDRGQWCVGMKTIDLPVFRAALEPHESWCDVFYWFHFQDVASTADDDDGDRSSGTAVVFGGALSYYNESIARAWLAELVFLAVRWESKVVSPVLLKY